jgi:hypothetical protein
VKLVQGLFQGITTGGSKRVLAAKEMFLCFWVTETSRANRVSGGFLDV